MNNDGSLRDPGGGRGLRLLLLVVCLVFTLAPPVYLTLVDGTLAGAATFVLGGSLLIIGSIAILVRTSAPGRER